VAVRCVHRLIVGRYADFDAALNRRGPLRFKLAGEDWTITEVGFQALATVLANVGDDKPELESAQALVEFFAAIVDDVDRWRAHTANLGLSTLMGLLTWVLENEVGMPLSVDDDAAPLVRSAALSAPSPQNGRSPAGNSHLSALPTR